MTTLIQTSAKTPMTNSLAWFVAFVVIEQVHTHEWKRKRPLEVYLDERGNKGAMGDEM